MNELVKKENTSLTTPMDLLSMAMAKGADIDQLEKLMALQERWEASEAKKAFTKAMSIFRAECQTINKTRNVSFGQTAYNYAGLAETVEQISPVLIDCGLSHRWETKQEEGRILVTCFVTHELGHSEQSTMSSQPDASGGKNSIQAIGSAISYLERYTLYSVLGLASKDDDGVSSEELISYTVDEQAIFLDLIKNDDALGLYLLSRTFLDFENQNTEAWVNLNGNHIKSIPRGGKGKEGERIEGLVTTGKEIVEAVSEAIENDDILGLKENIEDISKVTKNLLWKSLNKDQQDRMTIILTGE